MEPLQSVGNFFPDPNDYIRFLVGAKKRILASDDARVFIMLEKKGDYYLCIAQLTPTGKYVGDYVKPFRATQENVDIFNQGVTVLVERLNIYMMTGDVAQVPSKPPAFGELTHIP